MESLSLQGCAIVSCGTLQMELETLRRSPSLDVDRVFYCAPGLHEWPWELEKQLPRQLTAAADVAATTVVVYGERCFIDPGDPSLVTDALIRAHGKNAVRVKAYNCVDMLADAGERERMSDGQKVHWLTPGWLKHWDFIFKDWDAGLANEMFPAYDKAVVLDALGYFDELLATRPERILQISDWMKIPIESAAISLDRFKSLIAAAASAASE